MSVARAPAELKTILGRGLYPAAIPKAEEILIRLKDGDVHSTQRSSNPRSR